ncbi:MAG TPA: MBL fold metallo-hydrolase [Verrucomicrobiae bacterium]|nr:MBL fold metallo-hydrolase [Verrucomicrobiae bacterium]
MLRSRRKFLKYATISAGLTLAGGFYWLNTSRRRAGRLFRQILADSKRRIIPAPVVPEPASWNDNAITLAWLGHATVLINFYGIRILTDPILGSSAGVSLGFTTIGTKRYIAPALPLSKLPSIDVILLSHAHMDHMDIFSLRRLRRAPLAITARRTSDVIEGTGLKKVVELGWGEQTRFKNERGELEVLAFEVKHWGERWPNDEPRGYNGYVLRCEGKSLIFGGDTAYTPLFADLKAKGPHDLAIMPIGAYDPWIWNHCTPEEAVRLADDAGAQYIVPVHHQTFRLSNEPMNEPIQRFTTALEAEKERIALRQIGDTFILPGA